MRETDLQVQSKFFVCFVFKNCLHLELLLDSRTVFFPSPPDIISLGESSFVAKSNYPCVVYPTELFSLSVCRVYFCSPKRRQDFFASKTGTSNSTSNTNIVITKNSKTKTSKSEKDANTSRKQEVESLMIHALGVCKCYVLRIHFLIYEQLSKGQRSPPDIFVTVVKF